MMMGSWQGTVAVYLPQPTHDLNTTGLPPCKQPCRGHWLMSSNTTATLSANLQPQKQAFLLQLRIPSSPKLCLDIDLFESICEAQLLLPDASTIGGPAVLLLALNSDPATPPCKLGVRQGSQILAFKFSSLLDAQALGQMLKCAREAGTSPTPIPPTPALVTAPHSSQTQQTQESTQQLMEMDDEQLQCVLEAYLAEPSFLAYVDRLERVWERMEQAAEHSRMQDQRYP